MVKVRFGGDRWPLAKAPVIDLPEGQSFADSLPQITAGLEVSAEVFSGYSMHLIIEKSTGPEIPLSDTPAQHGLANGRTIFLKRRAGAAAPPGVRPKAAATVAAGGAAPPPPPSPRKSSPSSLSRAAPPPPPPPKKGTASPTAVAAALAAKAPPPPPPPKKSSASPSPQRPKVAPPPPPPPKKSSASPSPERTKAAPPPPPPKKKSFALPSGASTPRSASDGEGPGSPRTGLAPPPPPPPPKKSPAPGAAAKAPPPPPPKKAVAAQQRLELEGAMMAGGSDMDSDGDSSDAASSSDGGGAPAVAGAAVRTFPLQGASGGGGGGASSGSSSRSATPPPRSKAPPPPPPPPKPPTSSAAAAVDNMPPSKRAMAPPPPGAAAAGARPPRASSPQLSAPFESLREDSDAKLSALTDRIEQRLDSLHHAQQQGHGGGSLDRLRQDVHTTLQREIAEMRTELARSWEEQRAAALRQQNELEAQRADVLRQVVEREEQLHRAQAELLHQFQQRAAGQLTGGSTSALEEIRRMNAELREQLERKQQQRQTNARSSAADGSVDSKSILRLQEQLVSVVSTLAGVGSPNASDSLLHGRIGGASGISADPTGVVTLRNDQLRRFLVTLGIEKYFGPLAEREVDVASLLLMDDAELEAAGVATLGARKRIMVEAQRRRRISGNESGVQASAKKGEGGVGRSKEGSWSDAHEPWPQSEGKRRDHIKIIQQLFEMHDAGLRDRAEVIYTHFVRCEDSCRSLYSAFSHKYHLRTSTYRPIMTRFLQRHAPHLLPAIDVICDVHEDREAEFAEKLLLNQLQQRSQPATWLLYRTMPRDNGDGLGARAVEFYYNALVQMSQNEMPLSLVRRGVVEVSEETHSMLPPRESGAALCANPSVTDDNRSVNQLYVAASVALLMLHEPQRLTEFPGMIAKYAGRELLLYFELLELCRSRGNASGLEAAAVHATGGPRD